MTRVLRGLAALTLLAATPVAAQSPIADRMLHLTGKERPEANSTCRLNGGGPNVTGASTRLQKALENAIPENKRRLLREGRDLSLSAIQAGQASSSQAWYYYARTSLQMGDLAAADTAFTHLVALAPACGAEAQMFRVRAWSSMISAAATARTAQQGDSVIFFARAANQIDDSRPQGWYMIGVDFLEKQVSDSAALYLSKAFEAPADTSSIARSVRQAAAYQYGVVMFNKRDFANSVRGFDIALRLKPDDVEARQNLAAALRQGGMADSAAKIEQALLAAGGDAAIPVAQLFTIGVAQYNANDFAASAATFERIVAQEPFNRDALFNLAQSYKGLENADKLLEVAQRLHAVDGMSFEALQLVAQGYRLKRNQPKLLETVTLLSGAPVDVKVTGFNITASGATMTLQATGREGRDINDRVVRPAAIPIVVDFLDRAGAVVGTSEAILPALAPNATQNVTVTGTGAGIGAWRYRRK